MESLTEKLNLLFDAFSWEIIVRNNKDEVSEYTILVESDVVCCAYDVESLLFQLEDESNLLRFI